MIIERKWAMPNKWTFLIPPIRDLLNQEVSGLCCDPFCGFHSPAQIKNDLNKNIECEFHLDALVFLKTLESNYFDCVLLDPPYSIRQAKECYDKYGAVKLEISPNNMKYWSSVKDEIKRILKPAGKAICFGWSTMGLGINRGFRMDRILLVPHGGSRNDTLCTVETKVVYDRD